MTPNPPFLSLPLIDALLLLFLNLLIADADQIDRTVWSLLYGLQAAAPENNKLQK